DRPPAARERGVEGEAAAVGDHPGRPKKTGGAAGPAGKPDERERRMNAALAIVPEVGVKAACEALGVSRATMSRRRKPKLMTARPQPQRALSTDERARVLEVMNAERFMDAAPREVHAALLDEGCYLASVSTMYRILADSQAVRERRAVRRHPSYVKPELVARGPNEV